MITSFRSWLRGIAPDLTACAVLLVLWLLFFWRLFTPVMADQASLKQGDFSAQFVAFGGYQYDRFSHGEVPLWNPYNNGGLPFIADTQAAVFYPPRLLTIAVSRLSGTGWTYHALELEMTLHVLFYTLTMYILVRRMTGDMFAGVVAALIGGYGGYLSGYPPLQLALLEAGVWLPLAVLGLYEATRQSFPGQPQPVRWLWLVVTGFALGLSWMAGHPQTSFFLTYLLIAVWALRVVMVGAGWRAFLLGVVIFGVISFGVVAVTLLPGVEYLLLTSRSDLGFDAKGNGFPFQDVIQFILPGVVSLFSPLYIGLTGLSLVMIALWRRFNDHPYKLLEAVFWAGVAIFALILSFGANTVLFHVLYNIVPGMRFFRGQERAAFLIANSLAILAGMGAAYLGHDERMRRGLRLWAGGLLAVCTLATLGFFALWMVKSDTSPILSAATFSALIALVLFFLLPEASGHENWRLAVLLVIVLELFSVNLDAASNYDHIPPQTQLKASPLLDVLLADHDQPFRVDGLRVLGGNYGSLYELADIQGISPLFLNNIQQIVENGLPDESAWELFAVRYVWSDWDALNVPGVVLAEGEDDHEAVKLHQLTAPRPYALLMYADTIVDSDEAARKLLADPNFNLRKTVILNHDPGIDLPGTSPEGAGATVTEYGPEKLTVITNTSVPAVLSIAQVNYPGWYATVNGQSTEILRAYGGLSAVVVPSGQNTIELIFNPLTYRIGAILSLVTWSGLAILAIWLMLQPVIRRQT
ncbi:MAG TPA: YfhO family protein [Phototrophicaceae bacterium]|jgi:hypothetical protein|nr:YfhO family protein [Phototrophicaceae bacterium]